MASAGRPDERHDLTDDDSGDLRIHDGRHHITTASRTPAEVEQARELSPVPFSDPCCAPSRWKNPERSRAARPLRARTVIYGQSPRTAGLPAGQAVGLAPEMHGSSQLTNVFLFSRFPPYGSSMRRRSGSRTSNHQTWPKSAATVQNPSGNRVFPQIVLCAVRIDLQSAGIVLGYIQGCRHVVVVQSSIQAKIKDRSIVC